MQCRLCLQDKPLQRQSHIVPDFMYRDLMTEDEGFYKVHKPIFSKEYKTSREFRTGEYDSDLLCNDCDNGIINRRYENYSAKVLDWLSGRNTNFQSLKITKERGTGGVQLSYIEGIDYTKFKLFLLSILWRSSISKRDFFSSVSLGKCEEMIREMLFNEDPRESEDFPCLVVDIGSDEPILRGVIEPPKKVKDKGNTSYVFLIAGIIYQFFISKYNLPSYALKGVINKGNEMCIHHVPKGVGKDYFIYLKSKLLRK